MLDAEKREFIFILALLLISGFVYAFYTIPTQISMNKAIPYPDPSLAEKKEGSWAETGPRIFSAFVLFSILSGFLVTIFLLIWRSWRLYTGIRRHVLQLFGKALGLYAIATILATLSLLAFLLLQKSYVLNNIFGLTYPILLPITYAFSGAAAYYTLKFSYWFSRREEPPLISKVIVLSLFVLLLLVMASPYNWYGAYPQDDVLNLRPLTNLLLLILILIAIVQSIILLKQRLNIEQDPINKERIKLMTYGFALVLAIFIFNVIYELLLTRELIVFILTYAITAIAVVLIYIGLVAPRFYIERLKRKYY